MPVRQVSIHNTSNARWANKHTHIVSIREDESSSKVNAYLIKRYCIEQTVLWSIKTQWLLKEAHTHLRLKLPLHIGLPTPESSLRNRYDLDRCIFQVGCCCSRASVLENNLPEMGHQSKATNWVTKFNKHHYKSSQKNSKNLSPGTTTVEKCPLLLLISTSVYLQYNLKFYR